MARNSAVPGAVHFARRTLRSTRTAPRADPVDDRGAVEGFTGGAQRPHSRSSHANALGVQDAARRLHEQHQMTRKSHMPRQPAGGGAAGEGLSAFELEELRAAEQAHQAATRKPECLRVTVHKSSGTGEVKLHARLVVQPGGDGPSSSKETSGKYGNEGQVTWNEVRRSPLPTRWLTLCVGSWSSLTLMPVGGSQGQLAAFVWSYGRTPRLDHHSLTGSARLNRCS